MLTELRVNNLALIVTAELELGPGLTVLSGETGAGKTALLSSLKLLIGERGDAAIVGGEGDEARVEAVFTYGEDEASSVRSAFQEHIAARRIRTDGRSRCYLDDALVTVGTLSKTLGPYVDLYGQHEHQSLLKSAEQLRMLDEYAGESLASALQAYRDSLRAWDKAGAELRSLQELSSSSAAEREQAAFVLREVAKLAPEPGEYEALESELPRLQHAEQLAVAAETALEILRGEGGALEGLERAVKELEALRGVDAGLDGPLDQLNTLSIDLKEATDDVGRYASHIEYDPQKLQAALDRLGELDGLSRRFGPGMEQVFALLRRSEQLVHSTENAEEQVEAAEARLAKARELLEAAAADLAALRASAAEHFLAGVNAGIAELALAGASLEFSVQDLPFNRWNSTGSQSFELLYRPAPKVAARPLAKIASGGELSRVMLAIKGLLQSGTRTMTLVFDEIDAGIGGKTANAVAERLRGLARQHQVIVITHLAQIAVLADHHFLVSKTSSASDTRTSIVALHGEQRTREIARMLSGSSEAEALAHAEKLLKEAHEKEPRAKETHQKEAKAPRTQHAQKARR
ncbi:MAG: DNA repair protein RecN [Coriobacteriales bacterium]|jgi:DNA repair protein RecN (Recombination protein N)|nr:DNA repair protein RecN [Coriobacteriales bacterium]